MKFVVCSRSTDDSPEEGKLPIEMELSQPLLSLQGAEFWLSEVHCDHPELLDMRLYRPGRMFEIGIKQVDD